MICPTCASDNAPESAICIVCGAPLTEITSTIQQDALPGGTPLKSGEYRVGKVLGQGGFGITYLGSQQRLQRPVAIKEFYPTGCRREGATVRTGGSLKDDDFKTTRERFVEEARTLSRFQHPGIVRIYDYFEENETAYMAMERLRGKTLAKLLEERRGPLQEREALGYVERIAEALIEVHRAGLLHRDIKPDNIMLNDRGEAILIDFGSARAFAAVQTSRMTAMVTHGYAPLEQYGQRAKFGPYTDVYALGATLYHLLTGSPPASATDRAAGEELPSIREINPLISDSTERAVTASLQIVVKERTQNVSEWLELLKAPVQPSTPSTQKTFQIDNSTQPKPDQVRINPKDGAEMVFVPAGEFTMGGSSFNSDYVRPHKVFLDGFWIYKTPVTRLQYRIFCRAIRNSMPPKPSREWYDDYPIVNVSWNDAIKYCEWAGVRLPTEAEWEKAARGTDERHYPWGNDWDEGNVQFTNIKQMSLYNNKKIPWPAAPVESHPGGASPYGALDMAGNVGEWVADWYDEKKGIYEFSLEQNPMGPPSGTKRVVRGYHISFISSEYEITNRNSDDPYKRIDNIGFRCAVAW